MKPIHLFIPALALLSVTAQAQSSVTLYGVADAAVERVKGATTTTRMASGQQQGSRWGCVGPRTWVAGSRPAS